MTNKRATIDDIALLAGVSVRTVSRVINNSPKVGAATRKRVAQIIKDMNYHPSAQARGLAGGRSFLLGMIYDNPDALYINDIQRGVLSVCRELGYELVVHPCDMRSESLIVEAIGFVSHSKLDGVLILPPVSENNDLAGALEKSRMNYVRLASVALDRAENVVISNDRSAAAAMADHLVGLGHERIAYITGPMHMKSSQERLDGFRDELEKMGHKLNDDMIAHGAYTYESGVECSRVLLSNPRPPTAIFASNDEMAVGTIKTARAMGLKLPDELSVAGFDDSKLALHSDPLLTTIRRPVKEMAGLATAKLIAAIDGRDDDARVMSMVTPFLVARESTAALK